MLYKTSGMVLRAIPYNDKYAIIYMYTEAFGRVSYLVGRARGRKSALTKALFIPLSVLEMEVEHLNKRELQRIKEARVSFPVGAIGSDPVKNVLALFLSEVLFRVVKDTEPDVRLFRYLADSVRLLERVDSGVANFHIVFLLGLLRYLGIFPNVEYICEGAYFDLLNGVFTDGQPTHRHYLDPAESAFFARLLRIHFENMSLFRFSRQERVAIIHRILEYYRLHLPDFPEIKSLSVLQSLFD